LRKDKLYKLDIATVGDVVEYSLNEDKSASITGIEERKNYLSRKAPRIKGSGFQGERLEQIIAANIDQIYILVSVINPKFNNRFVDRLIVAAERSGIQAKIIINKIDLDKKIKYQEWKSLYEKIGYEVFPLSALEKIGIDSLRKDMIDKKTLFWGPSGAGKSSILNSCYEDLKLKVGEISNYHDKGKHTTVTSYLIKVDNRNTFVLDTPGIREINPYGITNEDLSHYFIEFNEHRSNCRFNTCTHHHEPGCGIIAALEKGLIDIRRYESYLNILESIEDDVLF